MHGPRWSSGLRAALLVTLLSRLALPALVYGIHRDPQRFFTPDGLRYLDLAESIARSGAYQTFRGIELEKVPGFPALLAVGVWMGHPVPITIALHLLLGLLTTGLCYAIARQLAGERAGAAAAVLYAVEPGLWVWSSMVLSETLFVALVGATVWFALQYERAGRQLYLLVAILLATLSAYVRIVGYVLPFALVLWFGLRGWRDWNKLRHACLAAGLAAALLGIWHVRNGMVAGYWGFASQFERAAYYVGAASVESRRQGVSYPDARRQLERDLAVAAGATATPASQINEMRARGLSTIVTNPVLFAATYASGLVVTLLHPDATFAKSLVEGTLLARREALPGSGLSDLANWRWRAAWQRVVAMGPVFWLLSVGQIILIGLYYSLAVRPVVHSNMTSARWLIALPALCFLLLSGGPHGQGRFRAPMMPSICVLAGIGWVSRARSHPGDLPPHRRGSESSVSG
jgi:4-amino-4-deoxy-L-arabinose transferase-like glycosyltransferase